MSGGEAEGRGVAVRIANAPAGLFLYNFADHTVPGRGFRKLRSLLRIQPAVPKMRGSVPDCIRGSNAGINSAYDKLGRFGCSLVSRIRCGPVNKVLMRAESPRFTMASS